MRSGDDENFDEAINSVLRSCQPTVVPSAIKAIFSDLKCETLTPEVPFFTMCPMPSNLLSYSDLLHLTMPFAFITVNDEKLVLEFLDSGSRCERFCE